MDQAEQLRTMRQGDKLHQASVSTARITVVTGGKGGVGKSNIALNLTLALSHLGEKICLIDADFGLANIDVLLGLKPKFHIGHVLNGQKSFEEILMTGPAGVMLIPAASGFKHLAQMSDDTLRLFVSQIRHLGHLFPHLIIDTAAGISNDVMMLLKIANEIIVVATPEPASVTDSYALIKSFKLEGGKAKIKILLNMCQTEDEGLIVGKRLQEICLNFLGTKPEFLGVINRDEQIIKAIRNQRAFLEMMPGCLASKQVKQIAVQLRSDTFDNKELDDFYQSMKGSFA